MKCLKLFIISILLMYFQTDLEAQQSIPKTLLWRISGKGLQTPSYLYGTMHLYDKRLFFFGDSVYNSIEKTEGFAMELNPDDMMDSIFSKLGASDTTSLLRKMLDKNKYDSVAKKLEKKFGIPADKITRKKLIEERESWYYKIHRKDDMKSIVDLYLYNIAHKQGKWVGGIEDVDDQLGIKDELGKDINIVDYLNDEDDKERKKYLEKMIGIYTDGDIGKIDEMSNTRPGSYRDILLLNRNFKMARRMDSLSHIRSSFFAVGAAHLPGDSGVIQVLRNRGFNVDPVFSSKTIAPEKYSYTAIDIPWIKFTDPDSTYSVEMPGKISNLDVLGGEIKFKVCADMVSNNFYMTAYTFASDQSTEDALDRMYRSYTSASNGFKKISDKKIMNAGIPGIEVLSVKQDIYYRIQIFVASNKYYLCIAGSAKKDNLNSKDVDRFLNSFVINEKAEPKTGSWVNYSDVQKAFSVEFPKKPSIDKLGKAEAGDHMESYTYTSIDLKNGAYYMMVVSETQKGFVISEDSLVFKGKLQAYKENNSEISDLKYFRYEDNPAMSFTAFSKMEGYDFVSKMMVINRGNRSYSIACVVQKGKEDYPDLTKFFRSFKLLPYKPADWAKRSSSNALFSTWVPSSIELDMPDSIGKSKDELADIMNDKKSRLQYLAHDMYSATTYNINVYPLSKYYWAKNDSTLYADQLERYYTDTSAFISKKNPGNFDSLIYKKEIHNVNTKGYEILVNTAGNVSAKKVRVYLRGDSVYHLFILTNLTLINNDNNSKFFTEFRFANENIPTSAFTNKTALILSDLGIEDSTTRANAVTALTNAKFTAADLPLLYRAYFKYYPVDTADYRSVNKTIGQAIKDLKDSTSIGFVKDNYAIVPAELPELKMDMLEILASQKTATAFTLVKHLLLTDPPVKGTPYALIYSLSDSLLLCKQLFPELANLYGDSLLGSGVIRLASALVDSGMFTKEILSANREGILRVSKMQLEQIRENKEEYPDFNYYVIDVLGKLNGKKENDYLYDFLQAADLSIKENAALALLKNNLPVAVTEMQKLAADTGKRIEFYTSLKKIGKEKLFPKEFFSQKKFAEGYLYNYINDDDYENNIVLKLVGEKTVTENGEMNRYYLFKFTTSYEDETESHLAICGPFDMNRERVEVKKEYEGMKVFFEENYSASQTDDLFEKFLKEKGNKESD